MTGTLNEVRGLVLLFLLGASLHLGKLYYPSVTQWVVQRSDTVLSESTLNVKKVKLKQDTNSRVETMDIK